MKNTLFLYTSDEFRILAGQTILGRYPNRITGAGMFLEPLIGEFHYANRALGMGLMIIGIHILFLADGVEGISFPGSDDLLGIETAGLLDDLT